MTNHRNPFNEDLEDLFRGHQVKVKLDEREVVGRLVRWNYTDKDVIVCKTGEDQNVVFLYNVQSVELIDDKMSVEPVPIEHVSPASYSVREFDEGLNEYVKKIRSSNTLDSIPSVRKVGDRYETVVGHRRFEAARRAGLENPPTKVLNISQWEALALFIDDHFPLATDSLDNNNWYTVDQQLRSVQKMLKEWSLDRLSDHAAIRDFLNREGITTKEEVEQEVAKLDNG